MTNATISVGDEVTATITGRAIHADQHGNVVIEYVKENGFTNRVAVNTGDSAVSQAPPPDAAELARREHSARTIADSCLDPEARRWTQREHAARWNDAYPVGTSVTYKPSKGAAPLSSRTTTEARMYADITAVVEVEGSADPIALVAVHADGGAR